MVFDSVSKMVIGKQNESGTVDPITEEDIEVRKRYKFQYTLPNNLDKDNNIDNETVEELEEELIEEELIEEEIVEEEEIVGEDLK